MLANMGGDNLSMLRVGVGEDVLNEVVTILVTGDVDKWNTRAIKTALADTIEIAAKKVHAANLETLLNNLGGKLIHAVFRRVADDMVNCSATISWSAMLTDVLNAPITELTMGDDVNTCKYFLNARALVHVST